METRVINEEYAALANDLIKNDKALRYIRRSKVQIIYLASDKEKKKGPMLVGGECDKVPDKWKWAVPYDFTITIYEPNVERFTEDQIKILLLHELLHVGIEKDGNEEKYYVVPHDIEDFRVILDRYGVDWANDKTRKTKNIGKRHKKANVKSK